MDALFKTYQVYKVAGSCEEVQFDVDTNKNPVLGSNIISSSCLLSDVFVPNPVGHIQCSGVQDRSVD